MKIKLHSIVAYSIVVAIFSIFPQSLFAIQSNVIDSLNKAVINADKDEQVEIFLKLSKLYRDEDMEMSVNCARRALFIANNNDNELGIARANIKIGICLVEQNDYDQAITKFFEALTLFEDLDDLQGQSIALNAFGMVYSQLSSFDLAKDYYLKSLKIKKEINDTFQIGIAYMNLGNLFIDKHDYKQALEYHLKSLNCFQSIKDTDKIAFEFSNIAIIYYENGNIDKTIEYQNQALELHLSTNNQKGIANSLLSQGNVFLERNEPDKAIDCYFNAADYFLNKGTYYDKHIILLNLGSAYLQNKDYKLAYSNFIKANQLAERESNNINIAEASMKLADLYATQKKYAEAFKELAIASDVYKQKGLLDQYSESLYLTSNIHHELGEENKAQMFLRQYATIRDQIFNQSMTSLLNSIELRSDAEKKISELTFHNRLQKETLSNQRLLIFILSSVLLMLIILFTMIYKMRYTIGKYNQKILYTDELLINIDDKLSNDMQKCLFNLSCHMANIQDNKQNQILRKSYKDFIHKFNDLKQYIVTGN